MTYRKAKWVFLILFGIVMFVIAQVAGFVQSNWGSWPLVLGTACLLIYAAWSDYKEASARAEALERENSVLRQLALNQLSDRDAQALLRILREQDSAAASPDHPSQ